MLRASVRQRKQQRSLLVVWKQLRTDFHFYDLSDLDAREQAHRLEKLRDHPDQQITPDNPPCSNISLVRLGTRRHVLIWAFHHLFLDGWSTSVFLRDVLTRYRALVDGRELANPVKPSFREYFNLRTTADDDSSERFWRKRLAGFQGSPKWVATHQSDGDQPQPQSFEFSLEDETTQRLNRRIRSENLTANSLAAACWAFIVSRLVGQQDVVFATTASGRNLPIEGLQNLVGLFANVVPVRVGLPVDAKLQEWLTEIRDRQFDAQPHEHRSLADITEWCQLEPGRILCESLLVVENFPLALGPRQHDELTLVGYKSGTTSNFPLTCYVLPGASWSVRIEFDPRRLAETTVQQIADQFAQVADQLSQAPWDARLPLNCEALPLPPLEGLGLDDCRENPVELENLSSFLEGQSETEIQLAAIWEEVLGHASVGLDDDFFELGGKSLTAVRLLAKVEKTFGTYFPPTILIEHPTIKQLAQCIAGGEQRDQPTLVRFNRVETGNPVVCIHVGGGHATYYRFLAKQFPDLPVVGLQPKGFDGSRPLRSFPKLAAFFIDQLDEAFGPQRYHLVGYCLSAPLCLEMTCQLEARQRPPKSLTIIDTPPKWHLPKSWQAIVAKHKFTIRAVGRYAIIRLRRLLQPTWRAIKHLRYRRRWTPDKLREFYRQQVALASQKSYVRYQPRPCSTPIQLVRSTEYASQPERDFHLDWRHLTTSEFSVQVLDAGHKRILFDPSAAAIAEIIRGSFVRKGAGKERGNEGMGE